MGKKRSYAILCQTDKYNDWEIIFPIKNDDAFFCPGMPQFFGGVNEVNETDFNCIGRELIEESDGHYELWQENLKQLHTTDSHGDTLTFYYALEFGYSAKPKTYKKKKKNKEMKAVKVCNLKKVNNIDDLLQSLQITATPEFKSSETYKAFNKFFELANNNNL